jgi:hypothetical protein
MTFPSAPRHDTPASIVGGILGGVAVAGSVLAFFVLREPPRDNRIEDSVTELRIAVSELRAQTAELRAQMASQPAPQPMMMPPPPPMPPHPHMTFDFSPPPPPPMPPGLEQAIQCPGEHRCTLDRAYIEELLANPATLARQARVIPSVHDGITRGFKMYGIRPGSLPKLLGYRNGDLVLSINGIPLNGMDAAMATYTKLRAADSIAVEIERKGERMVKTCDLR